MCRSLKILMILAFATLTVAACGKKGLLESPVAEQGKSSSEKKKEAKAAELKRKKNTLDPTDAARPKVEEAEHRPFVLDGLLR
jgi:predicted small lipoprotein YifL